MLVVAEKQEGVVVWSAASLMPEKLGEVTTLAPGPI